MTNTILTRVSPVALCIAMATPALAGPTYENNSGGTMTWYGHLNAVATSVDDGTDTTSNFSDGANSPSRVGVELYQPLSNGMKFRFRFETALGFTDSASFDQNGITTDPGWTRANLRHVDFSLEGDWGRFSAGQGSMAADGAAEAGFSNAGIALYSGNTDFNAGYYFRDSNGNLTSVAVGDAFANFDGSRRGRIRYDSPSLAGFTVSASYGQNILSSSDDDDYSDIALRYGNEFANGVELDAAIAYQHRSVDGGTDIDSLIGSVALAFDNGLSFAAAAGKQDDTIDASYYYLQAAYDADFFSVGKTSFGIDYFSGEDFNSVGSESEIVGVAVTQNFDKQDVEAYLAYQIHSFDEVGTDYEDVSTVVAGARWRF